MQAFSTAIPKNLPRSLAPVERVVPERQNVRARINESGDTLFIVSRVDSRADNISFPIVKQFERVFLVRVIVFSEYEIFEISVSVDDRKGIEFVVPDYIVRRFKRRVFIAVYKF